MDKPNLKINKGFIRNPNDLLINIKNAVSWDERMKARKTASFGTSYDYSGIAYPETEMPHFLHGVCVNIEGILGFFPNNCLLNYYKDGSSTMGYHSDSTDNLSPDTGVAIISLGAEREISFRHKIDGDLKVKYVLKHGDLLYMNNDVQNKWMHAIPKSPNDGERISLTFRLIIK